MIEASTNVARSPEYLEFQRREGIKTEKAKEILKLLKGFSNNDATQILRQARNGFEDLPVASEQSPYEVQSPNYQTAEQVKFSSSNEDYITAKKAIVNMQKFCEDLGIEPNPWIPNLAITLAQIADLSSKEGLEEIDYNKQIEYRTQLADYYIKNIVETVKATRAKKILSEMVEVTPELLMSMFKDDNWNYCESISNACLALLRTVDMEVMHLKQYPGKRTDESILKRLTTITECLNKMEDFISLVTVYDVGYHLAGIQAINSSIYNYLRDLKIGTNNEISKFISTLEPIIANLKLGLEKAPEEKPKFGLPLQKQNRQVVEFTGRNYKEIDDIIGEDFRIGFRFSKNNGAFIVKKDGGVATELKAGQFVAKYEKENMVHIANSREDL